MSGTQPNQVDTQAPSGQAPTSNKKNNRGTQFLKKQNHAGSNYKGSVEGMNGHVFQTYAEQSKRGEFQRTLEELQCDYLRTNPRYILFIDRGKINTS